MEHPEGALMPVTNDEFTVPVGPYSINTVRVEYGDRGPGFWQSQK